MIDENSHSVIICLQEFSLSIRYFIVNNLFFPSALQEPFASPWHCTTCSSNSPHVPHPVATAAQLEPVPLLVRQWGNDREEIRRCSCALINVFRHPLWDLDEPKYKYFSFRVVFLYALHHFLPKQYRTRGSSPPRWPQSWDHQRHLPGRLEQWRKIFKVRG